MGLEVMNHGLNMKFPLQVHVLNAYFQAGGTIWGETVEPFGGGTWLTEVGQ